jgi:hypothetical protein
VTANLLDLGLGAGLAVTEQLSFGVDFSLGWNRGLGFDPVTLTIDTGDITIPDRSVSHWRNTREIDLTVSYAVTSWFSATFGVANLSSELGPDGTSRGLFHAIDTQVSLGLSVSFDQLYLDTQPDAKTKP